MRRSLLLVVAVVVVGVATWVAMTGPPGALFHGAGSADPGPTTLEALGRYGEVPDFALTERSGRTVVRGKKAASWWNCSRVQSS